MLISIFAWFIFRAYFSLITKYCFFCRLVSNVHSLKASNNFRTIYDVLTLVFLKSLMDIVNSTGFHKHVFVQDLPEENSLCLSISIICYWILSHRVLLDNPFYFLFLTRTSYYFFHSFSIKFSNEHLLKIEQSTETLINISVMIGYIRYNST